MHRLVPIMVAAVGIAACGGTPSARATRRVDADWDCERLAAERDALFPPTPEVDW